MTTQEEIRKQIDKLADILVRREVATENTLYGCSDEEISKVESTVGHTLPLAYREFLSRMGRGAYKFYYGTDLFYPTLLGLTKAAHDLVAEDEKDLVLPSDAIAIIMRQGYQFMFIRAGEGDDPPVYYYLEQTGEFEKKADRLTEFLIDVAYDPW